MQIAPSATGNAKRQKIYHDYKGTTGKAPFVIIKEFHDCICQKPGHNFGELTVNVTSTSKSKWKCTLQFGGMAYEATEVSKPRAKDAAAAYAICALYYQKDPLLLAHLPDSKQVDNMKADFSIHWKLAQHGGLFEVDNSEVEAAKQLSTCMRPEIRHPRGNAVQGSWPDRYLPTDDELKDLQMALGFYFKADELPLLRAACLHASCGHVNFLRLAHLGDTVLQMAVTEDIFDSFPHLSPKQLHDTRTMLVKREDTARIARGAHLDLERYLTVEASHGDATDAMLGEMFEAVLGAVYQASRCRQVVREVLIEVGVLPVKTNEVALKLLQQNDLLCPPTPPTHVPPQPTSSPNEEALLLLQDRLMYRFPQRHLHLLKMACTHSSCGPVNFRTLAHLGDAVLQMAVTEDIFDSFPDASAQQLTDLRMMIIKREDCARLARSKHLDLEPCLAAQVQERSDGVLGEMFEAVLGAVYQSSKSWNVVYRVLTHLKVLPTAHHSEVEALLQRQAQGTQGT